MVHGLISRPEDGRGGSGGGMAGGTMASAGPASRPLDQLLHALSLANELLPPLSPSPRLVALVKAVGGGTEAEQDLFGKQGADAVLLQEFAASHGQMVLDYGLLLLPVFVDISVTIVNDAIRSLPVPSSPAGPPVLSHGRAWHHKALAQPKHGHGCCCVLHAILMHLIAASMPKSLWAARGTMWRDVMGRGAGSSAWRR
jgi:hypothetical protein